MLKQFGENAACYSCLLRMTLNTSDLKFKKFKMSGLLFFCLCWQKYDVVHMCLWTLQIWWTVILGQKNMNQHCRKKTAVNYSHHPVGLERPTFSNKTTLPREVSPIKLGGAMASLRVKFFASLALEKRHTLLRAVLLDRPHKMDNVVRSY